jgi:hypothetical protein
MAPASAFLARRNNARAWKRQAMANVEKGDRLFRDPLYNFER